MKRLIFYIGIVSLLLSGCCLKCDNREVITFSTWGSASEMAILRPIVKEFEAQNPDIRVEVMHIPQDYFRKLHLLFASKTAPDVLLINNQNIPVYAKFLMSFDDGFNKEVFFDKSIESVSYDGKVYAIPRDCSGLVVYYNKELFKKNGLAFPSEDWTVEDMERLSVLLTDRGKSVFGISYEPQIYYALPFMHYYNGGIFMMKCGVVEDIFSTYQSKIGLSIYKDLAYQLKSAPTPADVGSKTLAQLFIEGRVAMHISGRWMVPKYRTDVKFDWDVVNFPRYSASSDSTGWAISRDSAHKSSAKRFVMFLASSENIERFAKSGLIVPARKDVANSSSFLDGKPSGSRVFIKSVENSPVTVVRADFVKVVERLNEEYFNE